MAGLIEKGAGRAVNPKRGARTGQGYLVAYCRVSTARQGASGLGLEAQQAAVAAYAASVGLQVAQVYVEVESGCRNDRPQLARALAHARRSGAVLVIAKLDRLARNVAFLATLLESGVDLVACDSPGASRLTLHVLAAVAEAEAGAISQRTKAALAAYKARGGKLGGQRPECRGNLTPEARAKGAQAAGRASREAAYTAYADLASEVTAFRDQGLSLREIAARLNAAGHTTRRGRPWNAVQVARVLARQVVTLGTAAAPE